MSFLKSKIFGAMIILNFIIFGTLFQYQTQKGKTNEDEPVSADDPAQAITPVAQNSEPGNNLTNLAIASLQTAVEPKKVATKSDDGDELSALIGNAISELGSIDNEEANYISALTGSSNVFGGDADHLNKVNMGALSVRNKQPVQLSFEQQMHSLVSDLMETEGKPEKTVKKTHKTPANKKKSDPMSVESYIASLSEEADVRRNEVRMITVESGETLWIIAARAYGAGNLYRKIYKANPHIRNPNMIEVGDVLRVPI